MTEIARPQIITPEMLTTETREPLNGSNIFSSRCPYNGSVHLECSSELNEREVSVIWDFNELYNNWSSRYDITYYEHIKKTILILHYLQDDLNNENILFRISREKNPTIVESDGNRLPLCRLLRYICNYSQEARTRNEVDFEHDDTVS